MKFWWLTDFKRLSVEKAAVDALAAAEPWCELERWTLAGYRVAAEGVLIAHGYRYPVRLVYPDQFPEVPAWVEPQDPTTRWSSHQYGAGGALCLELRSDNWEPEAGGADVLRSAHNLLVQENPLGPTESRGTAPSAHDVGAIQSYDWGPEAVFISSGCHERIRAGTASDLSALRWPPLGESFPILVHDGQDRGSPRRPPNGSDENGLANVSVFTTKRAAPEGDLPDRDALIAAAGFGEDAALELIAAGAAVVIFAGTSPVSVFHVFASGHPFRRVTRILPDEGSARSGRKAAASSIRVAVVGAGSVGSKLAESLVRSGVERLTLVDGDVMLPGNIERHVLDWRDVGSRKVNALRRRLLNIVPAADIELIDRNLNWQRSAKTHASEVGILAECSIIVDATGDPATSLLLGAVANANGRPFVSVEVFEGGIGALVATCLPTRDAPYAVARRGFQSWCERCERDPPKQGGRRYEAFDHDGSPMVADDAAVTIAAGHAARAILDIADGVSGPKGGSWLLIGFADAWVFKGHGDTIRLSVADRVEVFGATDDADGKALAVRLLEEARDAAGDSR